jgi:ubiquinone/menaquinone biosynthesis C-methylase UbiE
MFFPSIYLRAMPFKILEYVELTKGLQPGRGERVLDLGCGGATQTFCLARHGAKVVALDIIDLREAQAVLTQAKRRLDVEFVRSPLQQAGFADDSFDKVFSFCVIEHIPEYEEVLKHCYRILKPGGDFVFSVDSLANIPPDVRERHRVEHHVAKYFTAPELRSIVERIGFRDIVIYPIFRSRYAHSSFVDGVNRNFAYGYVETLIKYGRLRLSEALCKKEDEGVFLAAKMRK